MSSFLHPALFWTLGLPTLGVVALPVLIHLINMMRHRRLEWAAMEFLLVSQKKHRTWVILKQLLLLLLRMAAVAAVVLMVAQPRLHSQVDRPAGRHAHASHRAAGRQFLDVGPLGRHRRVLGGQESRRSHRRQRRQARSASVVHAAAVFAGAAPAAPQPSPT